MALALTSRFILDLRLGPRTLDTATQLLASVALSCRDLAQLPLLLVDNHLPYPAAILQVFGVIRHRRRQHGRGRRKHPDLKPPPGLCVGVVHKVRDAAGKLLRVRTRALFGRKRDIVKRIQQLDLGRQINTAHIERVNGTLRTQQARLTRRTRNGSRLAEALKDSLMLWRDLYNWVRPHRALADRTPAMALGLADSPWTVRRYLKYPVHVSDLQRAIWAEDRQAALTSALNARNRKKHLPTS
jgi:hypothetical protein